MYPNCLKMRLIVFVGIFHIKHHPYYRWRLFESENTTFSTCWCIIVLYVCFFYFNRVWSRDTDLAHLHSPSPFCPQTVWFGHKKYPISKMNKVFLCSHSVPRKDIIFKHFITTQEGTVFSNYVPTKVKGYHLHTEPMYPSPVVPHLSLVCNPGSSVVLFVHYQ